MNENGSDDEQFTEGEIEELDALVRAALAARSSPAGADPTLELDAREGKTFGRFETLTCVGRGGFAAVYRAFDPKLHRLVALKIPHLRNTLDPSLLRRFKVEAEAVAKIDHSGVVALYEVGEAEGLPYLASAYCDGRNLSQWRRALTKEGRAIEPEAAARIALATARALSAAHDAEVIHRDLKPSNIVLQSSKDASDVTIDGANYRVRVVDFGLAKFLQEAGELTRTNFHLGTPPYMAPEQFSRRFGPTSKRTDVYGLGATLYALLAGRPPFQSDEPIELFSQILADSPPPLRVVRPGVSKHLAAICHRCLERQPSDRYASIHEVAEDLERYLQGKSVRANWSWLQKALVGSRRRRTLTAVVMLFAVAAVGRLGWARFENLRHEREIETAKAERLVDEKEELEYLSAVQSAFLDYEASNAKGIKRFLDDYGGKSRLHNVEWKLLRKLTDTSAWAVKTDSKEVHATAVSPDPANPFVACGLSNGRVEIRSEKDGSVRRSLRGHLGSVNWLEFLPGDKLLATCGSDGFVRILDVRTWDLKKRFQAHRGSISTGRVSPDGRYFVTCGGDFNVKIWKLPEFELFKVLEAHENTVRDVSISVDGKYLASCGEDNQQYLWEASSGLLVGSFPPLGDIDRRSNWWARHIHFVGTGPTYRLASSFFKGEVVVYNFTPGESPRVAWKRKLGVRRSFVRPGDDVMTFTRTDGAVVKASLSNPEGKVQVLGYGHESPESPALALSCNDSRGVRATGDRSGMLRFWSDARDSLGWTYSGFRGSAGFVGDDHIAIDCEAPHQRLFILSSVDGRKLHVEEPLKERTGAVAVRLGPGIRVGDEVWRRWSTGLQCVSMAAGRATVVKRQAPDFIDFNYHTAFPWGRDAGRGGMVIYSRDLTRELAFLSGATSELVVPSADGRWAASEYPGGWRLFRLGAAPTEIPLEAATELGSRGTWCFSPGCNYFVQPLREKSAVVVWSCETGARHAMVSARGSRLNGGVVTADGKRIVAMDATGRLFLWDAASGTLLTSFMAGAPGSTAELELDAKESRLLIYIGRDADNDDSVRVIDLAE